LLEKATLNEIQEILPSWAPRSLSMYIACCHFKLSMREVARQLQVQPSTVSRNLKRLKGMQGDPLFKSGLTKIACAVVEYLQSPGQLSHRDKSGSEISRYLLQNDKLRRESVFILEALSKQSHSLIVSLDLTTAILSQKDPETHPNNTRPVDLSVIEVLVITGCLKVNQLDKFFLCSLTSTANQRLIQHRRTARTKYEYLQQAYRSLPTQKNAKNRETSFYHPGLHYNAPIPNREAPLKLLARFRDRSGKYFLSPEQVQAGMSLKEDYELGLVVSSGDCGKSTAQVSSALRWDPLVRFNSAVTFAGPILGDVAVRCCCFHQGMEQIEKELEWSARSGKIVLRIALTQLAVFYANSKNLKPVKSTKQLGELTC